MKLLLLSTDLMISSLVAGVASQHGLTVVSAQNQAAAEEAANDDAARILVVDLRCPGLNIASLVANCRDQSPTVLRILAFGPHVHEASLSAAREAGCDAVATRGQFDRDAVAIIGKLLSL